MRERNLFLDGLRGIALLAVMGFHTPPRVLTGGWLGVDVFFVLSGHLISSILLAEIETKGRIDYPAFLLRRARRLLPALAVLLLAYAALAPLLLPPRFADRRWLDIATAAFYTTNLRETFWPGDTPLLHTWSLAIEEQFYLVWPFLLPALMRLGRRRAALVLAIAWVVLTVARIAWFDTIGGPGSYYFTPLHSTGLLIGAALSIRPIKTTLGSVAAAGLCTLILFGHSHAGVLAAQPAAEIATALIIAAPPKILGAKPLRFLGRISYGVYLWHIPILWAVAPQSLISVEVATMLSLLAGYLSHALIERRFFEQRAHFPPSHNSADSVSAPS